MLSLKRYTPICLSLPLLLLAACGDDADSKLSAEGADVACDEDAVGTSCDQCDEGLIGTTVCNEDGATECVCASEVWWNPFTWFDPPADAGTDAGKDAGADAGKDAGKDASTPSTPVDASVATPPTSGAGPKLPAIVGDCPELKSGTATIAGLSSITLEVGVKKSGGPLVFYWHGTGSSASEYQFMLPAAVRQDILNSGGIIVSPQGTTNTGADCSGTGIFKQGDFAVMDQIAACAVKNNGIDPRKIYTTGCSAGGLQAACMGMQRSSYIAAVAPNSGGETFNQAQQDKHTPALLTMHGGSSDAVGVQFSQTSATADKHYKGAGGFVMNCNHGGGHCGAPAALQIAAWEFMKAHPFGVAPEPYSTVPTSFPTYCQIF